jgi:hypothetical protein
LAQDVGAETIRLRLFIGRARGKDRDYATAPYESLALAQRFLSYISMGGREQTCEVEYLISVWCCDPMFRKLAG